MTGLPDAEHTVGGRRAGACSDGDERPIGRDAVVAALVAATTRLLITDGTRITVRQIAKEAGVNHGLVHTYFGSKRALLAAALADVLRRAIADVDPLGFPPPDLATRRGGELAKVLARVRLDGDTGLVTSYPVTDSWSRALVTTRPELDHETVQEKVITAASLALGWAVFADHLCEASGIGEQQRLELDDYVAAQVATIGGLPVEEGAWMKTDGDARMNACD